MKSLLIIGPHSFCQIPGCWRITQLRCQSCGGPTCPKHLKPLSFWYSKVHKATRKELASSLSEEATNFIMCAACFYNGTVTAQGIKKWKKKVKLWKAIVKSLKHL